MCSVQKYSSVTFLAAVIPYFFFAQKCVQYKNTIQFIFLATVMSNLQEERNIWKNNHKISCAAEKIKITLTISAILGPIQLNLPGFEQNQGMYLLSLLNCTGQKDRF